jgi:formylglycine-generating enzyme required for sulfatase activity
MRMRRLTAVLALVTGLVLLGATTPVWAVDSDGDGVDDPIDVCENTPPGTAVDAEGRPLGDIDQDCDTDLDDFALFQQGMTGPLAYLVIDTVTIGNLGNADDTHGDGYGGVAYAYYMGTYEVTAGQYTGFLNAVAATDTYGLYNSAMSSSIFGCKIRQLGSTGSYNYVVDYDGDDVEDADWVNRPVNFVSWGDAARFANWLHNGQPTGGQDLTTTEDGAYFLDGATSQAELMAATREVDARWVIPSEDEWYKTAYHKNDGVTPHYWDYPTKSDTLPTSEAPPGTDMANGSANYYRDDWAIGGPYYRTEVGAYDAKPSDSPYGTFDQGGNLWEWNETVIGSSRGLRGGPFSDSDGYLRAAARISTSPTYEGHDVGFRVAEVP